MGPNAGTSMHFQPWGSWLITAGNGVLDLVDLSLIKNGSPYMWKLESQCFSGVYSKDVLVLMVFITETAAREMPHYGGSMPHRRASPREM